MKIAVTKSRKHDRVVDEARESAIAITGLSKTFGHLYALRNIDLNVTEGDFLTLFGPNGAGKTTLLRIISTLTKSTSGTTQILGHDISKEPEEIRRNIGFIGHQTFLYEDLTAEENLRFYAALYDVRDMKNRIERGLAEVGLGPRRRDLVRNFSRGMQQRLAIARAMLHNPKLLLLDEPYTGLDQHAAQVLSGWLSKLRKENRTTLLVTHDIDRGLELADRVLILKSGSLAYDEPARNLNAASFKRTYHEIAEGTSL